MILFELHLFIIILMKFRINVAEMLHDSSIIHQTMDVQQMKLLFACLPDHLGTVITTPDFRESINEISSESEKLIATALIEDKFELSGSSPVLLDMATFFLPSCSVTSFSNILQAVKSSPWWNIDALFFIIDTSQEQCKSAAESLEQSSKKGLLSSIFVCYQANERMVVYTYNPYTNRAPYPWKEVEKTYTSNDRWTLFVRNTDEGSNICTNLDFEKTKFMDGYVIKGVTSDKPGTERKHNYDINHLLTTHTMYGEAIYLKTIFEAANITVIVNYDDPAHFRRGTASGYLINILNGSYDISLSSRRLARGLSATYPIMRGDGGILTQQQKFLRPEQKILAFYSVEVIYLTIIVLLISFVFILIIHDRHMFAFAAFDVLRLFLSVGMILPFHKLSARVFFVGIYYLMILLNASFQGNIAAFLTKPERPYIDNMADLQMHNYHIHTAIDNKDLFDAMGIKNPVTYSRDIDCTEFVWNNSSVACVELTSRMLRAAAKYNLHISKTKVYEQYLTHWCKNDWPLLKKINSYSAAFLEAGLYEYWMEQKLTIPIKKLTSNEMIATEAQYRPVTLDDLSFALKFFGVGIGISMFVFNIELIPWRKLLRHFDRMKNYCIRCFTMKFKWKK